MRICGYSIIVIVALSVSSAARPIRAAGPTTAPADATADYYAFLMDQADLDDAARAQVAMKLQSRDEALAAWDAKNARTVAEQSRALAGKRDPKSIEQGRQLFALQQERVKLDLAKQEDLISGLTPEQREAWQSTEAALQSAAFGENGTGHVTVVTYAARGRKKGPVIIDIHPPRKPAPATIDQQIERDKREIERLKKRLEELKKKSDEIQKKIPDEEKLAPLIKHA